MLYNVLITFIYYSFCLWLQHDATMNPVGWLRRELKEFKWSDGYVRLTLAVIVVAALLRFALAALSHPAGDSCWHLSVARFMAENGRIPFDQSFGIVDRQFFSAAPLFHFVAASVYRFFSLFSPAAAEFAVKLVSPLFGSLTLPFVFLLAKKLYDSRTAFFATLFVAFLPLHINSSVVSFVDSLTTLLAVLAVYFLASRKIFLSAIFIGLGMEAKQTMLVLAPFFFLVLLYYYRNNLRVFFSKSIISGIVIAIIGLPWFIRNYLLLGNPFWPFLSGFFGGITLHDELGSVPAAFSLAHLFSFGSLSRFYMELFGAPLGSLSSLSFVSLPFSGAIVAAWLAIIMVFFVPVAVFVVFVARHHKNKRLWLVYGWLVAFLLLEAVFIVTTGGLVSARYFLPAVPALALLWASGFSAILRKAGTYRIFNIKLSTVVVIVLVGSILTFAAVESAKTVIAANAWSAYSADFSWIRENTPKDALIGYNGQCMSYNVHRFSNYNLNKVDYVWVNQNFRLEPGSIVPESKLQQIMEDFTLIYQNDATGTDIYKRK